MAATKMTPRENQVLQTALAILKKEIDLQDYPVRLAGGGAFRSRVRLRSGCGCPQAGPGV